MTAKRTATPNSFAPRPGGSRIWRCLLVFALFVVAVLIMRLPALTAAGRFLVVDDNANSAPTHVLLLDAQNVEEVAAQMFHARPDLVLLAVARAPGRAMQLGVLPLYEDYLRDRLKESGVPSESLVVLGPPTGGQGSIARRVGDWLVENPDARVLALCEPLRGRTWKIAFDRAIPEPARGRIAIRAVRSAPYDETSWHKSKVGSAILLKEYLTLLYGTDRSE